jgi:hypothetical protein
MSEHPTQFIAHYFRAERAESYVFIAIGVAAILLAVFSWWQWRDAIWRGLAIPLIGVGLIQVVVGSTVLTRAQTQITTLTTQAMSDRAQFRSDEGVRMKKVNDNFVVYRWIEIAFVVAGLALILTMRHREFLLGLGIGLLLQGAIMLALDQFAERRGAVYAERVASWMRS